MADDPFRNQNSGIADPASDAFAITKSDSTVIAARALYVGTAGDVVVTTRGGTDVTFKNVPAGSILPVRATKVKVATTAADIVGLQ